MKSKICFSCQRDMSDHTKDQHYECALKLCNKMVIASSARGTGDQLIRKTMGMNQTEFLDEY